ncbi:carbohydrate ABC transporter permease [Cohnella cellulosilytica]|uniref:Carbohydrate ABC transporter permease n=1 Tax=Cohnella cellulosilytica TaxID=986710 RepID=A0ABW2F7B9_9BACL
MSTANLPRSRSDLGFDIINYSLLTVILVIVSYPLLFAVSASFSDPMKVLAGKITLLPQGFRLDAYAKVLEHGQLWRGYLNSIVYTVIGVTVNLIMTTLAAYPLARRDLKGRGPLMLIFVFTMFFSGGLVPTYLVVKSLALDNTMWALILPTAINTYNLIVMRTFFQSTIPGELYEAAHVDGCTNIGMLYRIVLPLSMPILAVMFLFYTVEHWNSYFNAMIYLSDRDKFTLQLVLREILIQSQTAGMMSADAGATERLLQSETIKYAVIIAASLPVFVLYPFVQRFFVQGVMIGAVKG